MEYEFLKEIGKVFLGPNWQPTKWTFLFVMIGICCWSRFKKLINQIVGFLFVLFMNVVFRPLSRHFKKSWRTSLKETKSGELYNTAEERKEGES